MTRTSLVLLLMMASGAMARAELMPIGYISIDPDVPIGGINTIGIVNLTGMTYGCSVPAGFQLCTDLTISGSVTFQFQNGSSVDTQIIPLAADLGPGLYDPTEFQFLELGSLISATFTGTISPTTFDLMLADGSLGSFTASPDIISSALTLDQPFALLSVNANPAPVAMPEGPDYTFLAVGIGLVGFHLRYRMRAAGRWFSSSFHSA